jgi:hypothetical protein
MSKRDRKPTNTKEPQPSPNRRDTKQLRVEEHEEMTEKQDLAKPPAAELRSF